MSRHVDSPPAVPSARPSEEPGSALDRGPLLSGLSVPERLAAVDRVVAQGGSGLALHRLAALAARLLRLAEGRPL